MAGDKEVAGGQQDDPYARYLARRQWVGFAIAVTVAQPDDAVGQVEIEAIRG